MAAVTAASSTGVAIELTCAWIAFWTLAKIASTAALGATCVPLPAVPAVPAAPVAPVAPVQVPSGPDPVTGVAVSEATNACFCAAVIVPAASARSRIGSAIEADAAAIAVRAFARSGGFDAV